MADATATPTPAPAPTIVMLAGRAFQVITQGTVLHDFWMHQQLIAAGLAEVELKPGETPDAFVERMLEQVLSGGFALTLLSGLVAPAELATTDWTPQVAEDARRYIEQLVAVEDKVVVRSLVAQALIGFFQTGLASLTTSRTSSTTAAGDEDAPAPTHETGAP